MEFKNIFYIFLFIGFFNLIQASGIGENSSGFGMNTTGSKLTTTTQYRNLSNDDENKTGFKDVSGESDDNESKIKDVTEEYNKNKKEEKKYSNQKLTQYSTKNDFVQKLKSSITRTKIFLLPSATYYPIVTAAYTIPYAIYKTMQYFEDKKRNRDKSNLTFLIIENKCQTIDKKINTFLENRGVTIKKVYEAAKTKITKQKNQTQTIENEPEFVTYGDFAETFRLWTRAIITGVTMWYAVKFTDKFLRSGKVGNIGKKYTNWQNRYDAFRILMVNRTWQKVTQFLNNSVIPTNATILYKYHQSKHP